MAYLPGWYQYVDSVNSKVNKFILASSQKEVCLELCKCVLGESNVYAGTTCDCT